MSDEIPHKPRRGAGDLNPSVTATGVRKPLSTSYKGLSSEQAAFFKSQTGIDDDDDLKTHIIQVAEKAYEVCPYACIDSFTFLQIGISTLPTYDRIIQLGKERPNRFLLDVGCCFGVDSRKLVADGFPSRNVVLTDLYKEFSDLGHDLFKTTPASYPMTFVAGDVFDPEILRIRPPLDKQPSGMPDLSTLNSLNPLAGHCAVIYASNFFHLFSEENQLKLAKALGGLLSPEPGSMICGEHGGNLEKGMMHVKHGRLEIDMYCHSLESWTELWDGEVFAKGQVKIEADMKLVERGSTLKYYRLQWSVVRL